MAIFAAFGQSTVPLARQAVKPVSGPPPGVSAALTFVEEFDSPALDPKRWQVTYADPADASPLITKRNLWNNREKQAYFDSAYLGLGIDPFKIDGGVLTIEARPLDGNARAALAAEVQGLPKRFRSTSLTKIGYSSGMISTRGRFSQRYGYFEMRARWTAGKGLWPAFWLLPEGGGWPPEIDIIEAHGDKPRTTFHSLHLSGKRSTTERVALPVKAGEFRTYGALWLPNRIEYYVDSFKMATIKVPDEIDEPMYLIANLAVGGAWPGNPDSSTQFPALLEIDYIRVWSIDGIL